MNPPLEPPSPRVRWRQLALFVALAAPVVAYLTLLTGMYCGQRALVFPAPHGAAPECAPPCQSHSFDGPHGRRIHTVFLPPPAGAATVAVFHGNGSVVAELMPLLHCFSRSGLGAYGVEYPGYGAASEYSPSESALYEDTESALQHLERTLGVPRARTVLLGHSLGTGVVVELARRGHGAKLVLVAPFTSLPDAGAHAFPFLPVRRLLHDRFDSLAKAPHVPQPTLIIHGTADPVVPFPMGQRLAAALPRAQMKGVAGGGHDDVLDQLCTAETLTFLRDPAP